MFFEGAMAAAGWFDRGKLRKLSASLRETSRPGLSTRRENLSGAHEKADDLSLDRMIWIDGVGGFLLTLTDTLTIGQPNAAGKEAPKLAILADLSRRHATLRRESGAYILEPHGATRVDGKPIDEPTLLNGGELIGLGDSVQLRFTKPHALSATGKLVPESGHRLVPRADAVLMMAESCVLGPKSHSHVQCPKWENEAILHRGSEGLRCRSRGVLHVDGHPYSENAPATPGTRIEGQDFSMSVEYPDEK